MSSLAAKAFAVWEILRQADEDHPISAPQIISQLKARYGIEAERKSIYRLIQQTLVGEMNLDIEKVDGSKGGYYLCGRKYEDWQIKLLVDAVASARFLCEQDARGLITKLLDEVSDASKKSLAKMAGIPVARSQDGKTRYAIDAIIRAIRQKRMLAFRYQTINREFKAASRKDGKIYHFSPYRLYWQDDRYYVVGNTDGYGDLSTYRPDRMINVSVADTPARDISELLGKNPQEALSGYLQRNIYRYGGEEIRLRLRCKVGMEGDLFDRFGKPESVCYIDSGFECAIPTQDSEGLLYWLLQNADSIKVLAPESVRQKLVDTLRRTLAQYDDPA